MSYDISRPALAIMTMAAVLPNRINAIIDGRIWRGLDAALRFNHHYPRTLRQRTNIPVVGIARKNRHLLLSIESRSPFWTYYEYSRNDCWLAVGVEVPDLLQSALTGEALGRLINTGTPVDAVEITGFHRERACWTEVRLAPGWVRR
jgi:hypothetical protein